MKEWKLERNVINALANAGYGFTRLSGGASPYSEFDLVAHPKGYKVGTDPATYALSPVAVYTADPATAYKGRHGKGRLFMAVPASDGLVTVASNGDVELRLADGMCLGKPSVLRIGDLFPS